MKTLIMMIGLPRSGKSTITAKLKEAGIPVVCPDDLRAMIHGKPFLKEWERLIWAVTEDVIMRALEDSDEVVLDATNLLISNRAMWVGLLSANFPKSEIKYVHVDTPASVCIARAQQNGQDYLIPIIEKLDKTKQIPNLDGALNPDVFYWRDYLTQKEAAV